MGDIFAQQLKLANRFTALMVAARKGRQEGIELLLKFDGIDVNAKDNNG